MTLPLSTRLSPEERLQLRYRAAERYMRGDIDVEEFEREEQQLMPDYEAIMRTLARHQGLSVSVLVARLSGLFRSGSK